MSSTYLDLTNELLRELNEVTLTIATFANAVGVQQHVKDSLNRAYFDIINEEPQWPYLAVAESGDTDPMYGNVYVETTAGTRFYELKPASSSITTDYGSIDWLRLDIISGSLKTILKRRHLHLKTIKKDYAVCALIF